MGEDTVTDAVIDRASGAWAEGRAFHSGSNPTIYRKPRKGTERPPEMDREG